MTQINYAVKSVKETEYFVDESVELEAQSDLNYNATIQTIVDLQEIHIIIMVSYSNKSTKQVFLKSKVTSVFVIQDLKNYARLEGNKEGVDLPDPLWITLFSISFTHARALLYKSAAPTKFSQMILPLINPEVEFKKIFAKELEKGLK